MELTNIPKEILSTEYPDLISQNVQQNAIILDNGQKVIIADVDANGQTHGKVYEFAQPDNNVMQPDPPSFSNTLAQVDCDQWDGNLDSNFRDDYNSNLKQIQHSINELINDNLALREYVNKLQTNGQDQQANLTKLISIIVAEYLNQNYYVKSEVDSKLQKIQADITKITSLLANGREYTHYVAPNITEPKPKYDGDDNISDPNVKAKIQELNNGGDTDDNSLFRYYAN